MSRTNPTTGLASRRLRYSASLFAAVVVFFYLASGLSGIAFGNASTVTSAPSHSSVAPVSAVGALLAHARATVDLNPSNHPLLLTKVGGRYAWPSPETVTVPKGGASVSTSLRPVVPNGGPSSESNYYVNGSDCSRGAAIAAVGAGNRTLVAANLNFISAYNGSGGSECNTVSPSLWMYNSGPDVAYTSSNGGVGWTPSYQTQNKSWVTWGNPTNNSTVLGIPQLAAGANGKVFLASLYSQPCLALGTCSFGTVGYLAPSGVSVTVSSTSGTTWAAPVQISAVNTNVGYFIPSSCGGPSVAYGPGNVSETPSVAYAAGIHTAIVTWDVLHYTFNPNFSCNQLNISSIGIYYAITVNDGVTWSAVKTLNSGLFDQLPQASFGPAPNYNASIVTDDFSGGNATQTGTGAIEFTFAEFTSSNKGATFSAAKDVGSLVATQVFGVASPDVFGVYSQPSLTTDNWTGSPYSGNKYIVWEDNQSGSYFGYPAIGFMVKGTNSVGWSAPSRLTPQTKTEVYFMPTVAVGPNGAIWVTYYGEDHTLGSIRMFGVVSNDGGTTWSSQFIIADADSLPGTTIGTLGSTTGLAVTSAGAFPAWADCRSSQCTTTFIEELYTAWMTEVTLKSNVPNVNLTIDTFGQQQVLALPATSAFAGNSAHTVSVPQWFPGANTSYVETFQNYSGLAQSSNYDAGFLYSGGTTLNVNYIATPAGWIAGTFSPVYATASLKINGNTVPLTQISSTQYKFNFSVAAGTTYNLNATAAPYYQPLLNQKEPVAALTTTSVNIVLPKVTGVISGVVQPALGTPQNVTVTINGTTVTPSSSGTFMSTVAWGFYWVNASESGLTPYSTYVQVNPGSTTPVTVSLAAGWINGTVTNAGPNLRVSVDGLTIPTNVGTFSVQVLGGFHAVAATQPGYNLSVIPNLKVQAGQTSLVTFTLTNQGSIQGLVGPAAALPVAVLHIFNSTTGKGGFEHINPNGTFSVLFTAGTYTVNVTATGYVAQQSSAVVTAGNQSSFLTFTLVKITQCTGANCNPCVTNCGTTGGGGGGSNSTASGLSTVEVIGIAAVVGIIVIAALVVLTRRGRGGGGGTMDQPPMEDQTYQGGATADLPRLQSDGTMDGGNPPPPPPPDQ